MNIDSDCVRNIKHVVVGRSDTSQSRKTDRTYSGTDTRRKFESYKAISGEKKIGAERCSTGVQFLAGWDCLEPEIVFFQNSGRFVFNRYLEFAKTCKSYGWLTIGSLGYPFSDNYIINIGKYDNRGVKFRPTRCPLSTSLRPSNKSFVPLKNEWSSPNRIAICYVREKEKTFRCIFSEFSRKNYKNTQLKRFCLARYSTYEVDFNNAHTCVLERAPIRPRYPSMGWRSLITESKTLRPRPVVWWGLVVFTAARHLPEIQFENNYAFAGQEIWKRHGYLSLLLPGFRSRADRGHTMFYMVSFKVKYARPACRRQLYFFVFFLRLYRTTAVKVFLSTVHYSKNDTRWRHIARRKPGTPENNSRFVAVHLFFFNVISIFEYRE